MKNLISFLIVLLPFSLLCQSYIVNEYEPKTDSLLVYFDTDNSTENYFSKIPTCKIECDKTSVTSSIDAMLPNTKSPCTQKEKIIERKCSVNGKSIYHFNQYNGKIEGYYLINHPSGNTWIRYIYKKNKITDIVEHYYDSSSPSPKVEDIPRKLMALVELDEEGKLKNIKSQFDLNGDKLKKGNFRNGNGTLLFYRGSGSLLRSVQMKNGRPHGKCTYYYPSGQKLTSGEFSFGLFSGIWHEYSKTEVILASTKFTSLIED
jgi:antitoxin component YwqK of YwqJK toxin-antitoxin module